MLYTPAALELALRCPLTGPLSSVGDDDRPEMAESTLVRSEGAASTDMLVRGGVARFRCFFNDMTLVCNLEILDLAVDKSRQSGTRQWARRYRTVGAGFVP